MSLELHNYIQLVPDVLLALWFFHTIKQERKLQYWQAILAIGILCSTIILHMHLIKNGFLSRFLYRALCYCLFIKLWHGVSWKHSIYFALFTSACWTACQNILFTPLLFPVAQANIPLTASPVLNEIIFTILRTLIMGIPLVAVSLLIPFKNITGPGLSQWGMLSLVILCDMYVKSTLNTITKTEGFHPLESSIFPIILQLFLLAFMAFFERSLYNAKKQQELRMQEVVNHYRLRNLENKQAGDMDLRRLHHDMKNHLLAIKTLSNRDSSNEAVNDYINTLIDNMQGYEAQVHTGNSLLDGLLSQKLAEAAQKQISMDLIIDFRNIHFIEDMDLCTIFGNAVDNAIEASAQVKDPQERVITLRTQESAGQLLISAGNTYEGSIRLSDGLPATSKNHPEQHGIGLRNIRRVLKKYDGVMDINLEQPGWFNLTMLLPLPKKTEEHS